MPVVVPLGWQVTRVPPYVRRPFPSKKNRQISERDDLHPSYQGVRRSVWDPETFAPGHKSRAEARPTGRAISRERLGDRDGPMAV